jgi:putative spermidine/putrescine transport system substrate-binding protein
MKKVFMLALVWTGLVATNLWAQTITVCSYGGTYNQGLEESIAKPFTQATGIKVIVTAFPTYAQMETQVKSGNIEWDIVECESRMYARGTKAGIFEPLDLSLISTKDFVEGSVTKDSVGLAYYAFNMAYSTNKWPAGKGPQSMKDFWDVKKFPGPRTMKFTAASNLEAALLADGVPRNKVYPLDVDRAFKKLTELKPHIRVWWKTGGQAQQVMREKEADLGWVPSNRMIQLMDQKVPITQEWGDQLVVLDSWTILKGSKNRDAAMKFIAFASDPRRQAAFGEANVVGPANKKAYEFVKKEKAVVMPTYPENLAKGLILDATWWADHEDEIEKKWESWKMQ